MNVFSRVITLGPNNSWSHIATKRYLRKRGLTNLQLELLTPINRSEGIIQELARLYDKGINDVIGVVPIYNTSEGRVKDTLNPYRGLLKYQQIKIYDEIIIDIAHCLAAKSKNEKITSIVSHPQALAQCSDYIRSLGAHTVEAKSTAEAAKIVAQNSDENKGAICSEEAAREYELEIVMTDIQNKLGQDSENKTIFNILWYKDHEPTGRDKTTLTCELYGAENPGSLYRALGILADSNINLSKIESMEKGSRTEYVFWMNIDEHRNSLRRELKKLNKLTKWLYVHGSYPRKVS